MTCLTGEGLEKAVRGIETVIHCASGLSRKSRQVDVEGTGRLLEAAASSGVSHLVYISIVGIDRLPSYPCYRIKLETGRLIEDAPVPHTLLRTTQFHDFLLGAIRFLERLPVMVVPKGFLAKPIDAGEVAARLVELALSSPGGRVRDVGGPEVLTLADAVRSYLDVTERRRKILEVPLPGKTARAVRDGPLTCPNLAYGKTRWEEFLHHVVRNSTGGGVGTERTR